jgi:hypothetical protein
MIERAETTVDRHAPLEKIRVQQVRRLRQELVKVEDIVDCQPVQRIVVQRTGTGMRTVIPLRVRVLVLTRHELL